MTAVSPNLSAAPGINQQGLPTSVLKLWRQFAIGRAVFIAFVLALIVLAVRAETDAGGAWYLIPLGALLLSGALGWLWATAKWRAWSWELTGRWVTASWGVLRRRTVTIPRNRVQTVTTDNGPIDRMLDLTSITIHTAGAGAPNLSVPHLSDTTVEWLREQLGQGVAQR